MVRPKLLFVDDEVGIKKLVEQYLQLSKEEYDVVFAHSGEEAIEALERHNPLDLLITDIRMPEIDGWELVDISRNNYNLKTIIISAFGTADNLKRAYENQVSDFFIKPFKFKNLFSSIKRIVGENPSSVSTIEKVTQPEIGGEKKITYSTIVRLVRELQPVQQVRLMTDLLRNFDLEQLEAFQIEIPSLKEVLLEQQKEREKMTKQDTQRVKKGLVPISLIANSWIEERWIKSISVSGQERQYLCYNIKWKEGKKLRSKSLKREDLQDPEVRTLVERKLGRPINPSFFER
jgi:hypothetical protein